MKLPLSKRVLKPLIGALIFFLSLPLLSAHMSAERERVKFKTKLKTLDLFRPASFSPLTQNLKDPNSSRPGQAFIDYYEKVVEYFPHLADAHHLLAFCYYHAGQDERAIAAYQKAIELNPHFFWAHYNLGVIYFQNNLYGQAIKSFHAALKTRPENITRFVLSSRIYRNIMARSDINFEKTFERRIKRGYRDCQNLLALSRYYLGRPQAQPRNRRQVARAQNISLRIF